MNAVPSEGELELPDPYDDQVVRAAREIADEAAREAVASLCGLVLRRLQDVSGAGMAIVDGLLSDATSENKSDAAAIVLAHQLMYRDLSTIFGEALHDFSQTTDEPGQDP